MGSVEWAHVLTPSDHPQATCTVDGWSLVHHLLVTLETGCYTLSNGKVSLFGCVIYSSVSLFGYVIYSSVSLFGYVIHSSVSLLGYVIYFSSDAPC